MQFRVAGLRAKGDLEDLRTQAGTAHTEQQSVGETGFRGIGSNFKQWLKIFAIFFHHVQPAEPLGLVIVAPDGGVALPEAGHFPVGLPVFERSLHGLGERGSELPAWRLNDGFRGHGLALFCSTTVCNWLNASSKRRMASSRSVAVTCFMEMPAFSRSDMALSAAGRSASRVRLRTPWSRKASMVAGGMVLTVSGPISSSIYRTSRYLGFLVLVLAQSR